MSETTWPCDNYVHPRTCLNAGSTTRCDQCRQRGGEERVDQTILASDPKRRGNCVPACVATFLGIELDEVPHFLEVGEFFGGEGDRAFWWCHLVGFAAGRGFHVVVLDDLTEAEQDEVVFVSGMSDRGVMHQVLYRNGELWHDPHPAKTGVVDVREIEAWRPGRFNHSPSEVPA